MTKPLIGVCGEFAEVDVYDVRTSVHFSMPAYARSVERAGGIPVILPITDDERVIDALINRLDGVLVTGGVDIDPAAYGQEPVPELDETQPHRDRFEFELIRRLVERNVPTLGVCRGIQSLTVAMGGELIQHVDGQMVVDRFSGTAHTVEIEADSRLAAIVGTTDLEVNSLHHQVIAAAPDGSRAVAHNPDGHIEAIEFAEADQVLGVQWHPEMIRHRPQHLALFEHLVRNASA
ncbi:MAG: gamma-glutamyl-gamma-aminobutyrate hydrolase family protein [Actinomycetota bacterium]